VTGERDRLALASAPRCQWPAIPGGPLGFASAGNPLGKFFRGEPPSHGARRTAELQANCQHNVRWIALSMGFPAHHPVAVGHAMALRLSTERVTGTVWRQWPQLYPQRTGRCKPWLPYSLCLLYPGIPDIIEVKIETKAKIVVPYHSRYSWELTQLSRRT
jgi:hypothetical protein